MAKCIRKNKDRFQAADSWIGKIIRTRTDTRTSLHTNLFKLSFGRFLSFKFRAKKRPNDNLKRFVCKLALVSVLV